MANNVSHLLHKKSSTVIENNGVITPKLPNPSVLLEGEIAVNFAEGYETLSIKNSSGDIATFSSDNKFYTKDFIDEKLGSGFTNENSANTVTKVIEDNELTISTALNSLNETKLDASAYTPTDLSNYYTKDETSGKTELSTAFGSKVNSATFTAHTADTSIHLTSGDVKTQIDTTTIKGVKVNDSLLTPDENRVVNVEIPKSIRLMGTTPQGHTLADNGDSYYSNELNTGEAGAWFITYSDGNILIKPQGTDTDEDGRIKLSSDWASRLNYGGMTWANVGDMVLVYKYSSLITAYKVLSLNEAGETRIGLMSPNDKIQVNKINGILNDLGKKLPYSTDSVNIGNVGDGAYTNVTAGRTNWIDTTTGGATVKLGNLQIAVDASGRLYSRNQTLNNGIWNVTNELITIGGTDLDTVYVPSVVGYGVCQNGPTQNPLTVYTLTSSDTDGNGFRSILQIAIDRNTSKMYVRTTFYNTTSQAFTKTDWMDTSFKSEMETALGDKLDISASTNFFVDAKYETSGSSKVINFYHDNTIKATINADDFIKDGMISGVTLEAKSGTTYLVIEWNTDAGIQTTELDVGDLFEADNYYTKDETSGKTEISNALDGKVDKTEYATFSAATNASIDDLSGQSETIAAALNSIEERKLDASAYTPTDLSNYYTKDETSGKTEISNALSQKQNTLIPGTNIEITNNVISVSGITVDQVIDDTTSASTNSVATQAVYNTIKDTELVWTNAYVTLNNTVSAHTNNANIHLTTSDKSKLNSITGNIGTMAYEDKSSYSSATEISTALNSKVDETEFEAFSAATSGAIDTLYEQSETISASLNDLEERKLEASSLSNYYEKDETSGKTEISNALGGKVNTATFTAHTADTSIHLTSGDVKAQIDEVVGSGYTDATITETIENMDNAIAAALNDLDNKKVNVSTYGETIHYLTGTTGAAGGTNLSASWSGNSSEVSELYTGLNVQIKLPIGGHTSGVTLSINGGERHPVIYNNNAKLTTQYPLNAVINLIYDETATSTYYSGSSTAVSVTGCWRCEGEYWSNTDTVGYYIGRNQVTIKTDSAAYRYMLMLKKDDTYYTPVNTTSNSTAGTKTLTTSEFDPFGNIIYKSSTATTNANANIPSGVTWTQYPLNLAYSFNTTNTLTATKPVYMVAVPQSNGMAKLHTQPISQALPTTDDGLIYIYLGQAYSTTSIYLMNNHPIYYFKNGQIRQYVGNLGTMAYEDKASYSSATEVNEATTINTIVANGHDYIEIGGIKWATMNVGATAVTDTGLYFQWGDTQGYTASQVGSGSGQKYFGWADYKWTNDGGSTMTKYNSTDGKTVLDTSDDAVMANWGGSWRMPTTEEFVALGNAVNTAWTADYQGSGVSGLVCTDKTDSSKVLFFPAAGSCSDSSVNEVGTYGNCWSSSVYSSFIQGAYFLDFSSSNVNWQDGYDRYHGYSVRGVVDGSIMPIKDVVNNKVDNDVVEAKTRVIATSLNDLNSRLTELTNSIESMNAQITNLKEQNKATSAALNYLNTKLNKQSETIAAALNKLNNRL